MKPIQELIDATLIRPERVRSGKWSPSSFGNCFRAQFWNRKDVKKSNPPDERSLRVFAAGQLFHDFVQGIMQADSNGDCQIEVIIDTDPDVLGYCDLVRANEVVDIKSQHSKMFWWMNKKGADVKKEKYGNWLQVMYYAIALEKEFARLVFISKDDLCIQEYVQPVDDYWTAEVLKELCALRMTWEQNVLPAAQPRCERKKDGTYWHCNYCGWKDLCIKTEHEAERKHPNEGGE